MTNYISTPLSTINADLNEVKEQITSLSAYATKDELTAYAQLSDIPTDLSSFTNSPGYLTAHQDLTDYATKTYVDEKIGDIDSILDFINGQTI